MSSTDERSVLLDELLERLPSWLELVSAEGLAPTLRDRRDGVTWRLFTAGEIELGATPQRLVALQEALARNPLKMNPAQSHFPPRRVKVDTFLMRERVILEHEEDRVVLFDHAKEAARLLERFGATLPSEAQFEYAWNVVQVERGGWVTSADELCRDAWSLERYALEHLDVVPGGAGVVRTASLEPGDLDWVLPARRPLSINKSATIRPTITPR